MRRFLHIAAVNAVLAAGLLLFIEGCVRQMHPEIGPLGTESRLFTDSAFAGVPGPRPLASGTSNGARFEATADGFWHYSSGASKAEAAWLFLGDSVTMGVGVEPDRTFAGRLAALRKDVRVLNPSLMGHSVEDYVDILEAILARRDDVARVTLFWCLNDIYRRDVPADGSDDVGATEDPNLEVRRMLGPVLGFIHRRLYSYQWLKASVLDRPRRYFEHDAILYEGKLLDAAVRDLSRMSSLCSDENLRCEIVLLPYEYQLRAGGEPEVRLPQHRLRNRISELNLPVYDPTSFLLEQSGDSSDLYLYGDGIHFSERGHYFLAKFLETLGASSFALGD